MKIVRLWTRMVAALAVGAIACSGDDGGGGNPADLVGTWTASKVEFVSATYGTVDLVSKGGSATLVLNSNMTYTATVRMPGQPDQVMTGTWNTSDGLSLVESPTSQMQFNYVLAGNTLTLTGADSSFDFNGDSIWEPAKLNITASR